MKSPASLYLESLSWRRVDLSQELQNLTLQREEIMLREAAIVNQLRSLDVLIEAETHGNETVGVEAGTSNQNGASDAGSLILDAAAKALRTSGGPMHYKVLARKVQDVVPVRGKNPAATLLAFMARDPKRFKRVDRGCYALVNES